MREHQHEVILVTNGISLEWLTILKKSLRHVSQLYLYRMTKVILFINRLTSQNYPVVVILHRLIISLQPDDALDRKNTSMFHGHVAPKLSTSKDY